METPDHGVYSLTERRIGQLTLAIGATAAIGASFLFSVRVGAGVFLGSVLAWLNFRWLGGALDSIVRAAAHSGSVDARVPLGGIFRLVGRYALIAIVVYVIFSCLKIP